jgi:hypothetical protein
MLRPICSGDTRSNQVIGSSEHRILVLVLVDAEKAAEGGA